MSEYQYYEFQTIDRRLDEKEMQDLRGYSSRAHITPMSFTNEYSFGSFKGNADAWMEKYFDAYFYVANWGTHELQVRVPARLLPAETARDYCAGEAASVRENAGNLIFTFLSNEEAGGEWLESSGVLASILPVRDDLICGDLRALYLGWLLCVQEGELDDDLVEPPLPPNLRNLTPSLSNLAAFLRIDSDLLAVAAEASPSQKLASADRATMAVWVASLPAAEKDDLLVRIMEGKEAHIGTELCSRFNCQATISVADHRRRTVGQLLAAAKTREQNRRIEENRCAAREKMDRERLAAIAREKHLDSIVGRVPELWRQIEDLISPPALDLCWEHGAAVNYLSEGGYLQARLTEWMEPFARTIDAAKKYVVSNTLERVDWNAELLRGDLAKAVEQLKREAGAGKGLFVGGVKLPLALAELGLIDEYEFVVHPRLAGHGPTLFAGLSTYVDLKLVSRREFGSGAVALRYEPRR